MGLLLSFLSQRTALSLFISHSSGISPIHSIPLSFIFRMVLTPVTPPAAYGGSPLKEGANKPPSLREVARRSCDGGSYSNISFKLPSSSFSSSRISAMISDDGRGASYR